MSVYPAVIYLVHQITIYCIMREQRYALCALWTHFITIGH